MPSYCHLSVVRSTTLLLLLLHVITTYVLYNVCNIIGPCVFSHFPWLLLKCPPRLVPRISVIKVIFYPKRSLADSCGIFYLSLFLLVSLVTKRGKLYKETKKNNKFLRGFIKNLRGPQKKKK